MSRIDEFNAFRERMNDLILSSGNRPIKRAFGLDTLTYQDGALDARSKEMLGLATSMVLRCDDCIAYHTLRCKELEVSDEELFDIFSVALTVGGTIVIPHLRRAVALLEEWHGRQD